MRRYVLIPLLYFKERHADENANTKPLFGVDLARKDVKHVLELAKTSGAKMDNMEVADKHLESVQKHMGSRGDIAGIYGAVRQEAGLKFENDSVDK